MPHDEQLPEQVQGPVGPRYWRSLDELSDTPAFQDWLHREFPQGASEAAGVNRRHFLKIMAAGFALGGLGMAGCRRPERGIRPYGKQPERVMPGVPVHYASSQPRSRGNIPLVVETHQNRPIKLEGNPRYTPFGGATDAFAQASILDLYDPDRATGHYRGTTRIDAAQVNDLLAGLGKRFAASGGAGLAFLAEPSTSPTRQRLVAQVRQAMPQALWVEYEPVDQGNAERAATALYGQPTRPLPDFGAARRILSLDCDFIQTEPGSLGNARAFTASRKINRPEDAERMNRLYVVESAYTLTGAAADHRLRLASSHVPAFAALLLAEVLAQMGMRDRVVANLRERAHGLSVDDAWITECASDLLAHRRQSLVVAGAHQPVGVHLLTAALNEALSGTGHTVRYVRLPNAPAAPLADLANAGELDTLVVLGGNPAYDLPGDVDWAAIQKRAANVIRLGYAIDETALSVLERKGHFLLQAHYLESWGDGRTPEGTIVPVQPTVQPLFNGLTELEVLARIAGAAVTDAYQLVFDTFAASSTAGDKQHAFDRFLFEGLLEGSAYPAVTDALPRARLEQLIGEAAIGVPVADSHALEVRIVPDCHTWDGRYANNGWLQELPDPISKITWDNSIWISPALAQLLDFDPETSRLRPVSSRKLGLFKRGKEQAPIGVIEIGGRKVSGPVQILPGLADHTVVVSLGYGRRRTGRVGSGTGFSAYPLTAQASMGIATGAKLTLVDGDFPLANTQEHWSMEGRAIIRETTLEHFVEAPDFAQHMGIESHSPPVYGEMKDMPLQQKAVEQPRGNSIVKTPAFGEPYPNVPVWNTPEGKEAYKAPQQWGMAIDLNTCVGCSACVIACQAENNIPIVGKDQVRRGREMHWMRIDRYFSSGDYKAQATEIPHEVQASFQPMLCQHCERAPCEQVCPVNATVHDTEGLNVMAYNRCVGTRYCSNNCPYKVRRFNFMDWNKREIGHFYEGPLGPNKYEQGVMGELAKLQKNPEVTVRMRGVMEKCTFCLQRIQRAKIAQKVKVSQDPNADHGDTHVPDGVIKTACQQVCPTDAIEFGDISDADSLVSKLKASPRNYSVLGYLNTRPRTTYLARVRNPNPKMPGTYEAPFSYQEYHQAEGGKPEAGEGKHGKSHEPAATATPGGGH